MKPAVDAGFFGPGDSASIGRLLRRTRVRFVSLLSTATIVVFALLF